MIGGTHTIPPGQWLCSTLLTFGLGPLGLHNNQKASLVHLRQGRGGSRGRVNPVRGGGGECIVQSNLVGGYFTKNENKMQHASIWMVLVWGMVLLKADVCARAGRAHPFPATVTTTAVLTVVTLVFASVFCTRRICR